MALEYRRTKGHLTQENTVVAAQMVVSFGAGGRQLGQKAQPRICSALVEVYALCRQQGRCKAGDALLPNCTEVSSFPFV